MHSEDTKHKQLIHLLLVMDKLKKSKRKDQEFNPLHDMGEIISGLRRVYDNPLSENVTNHKLSYSNTTRFIENANTLT